jgi:hypothetical protein
MRAQRVSLAPLKCEGKDSLQKGSIPSIPVIARSARNTQDFSTGEAPRRSGVPAWKVRRLYETRLLPDTPRVGRDRVLTEADLPAIEAKLREVSYLIAPDPGAKP